MKLLSSLPALIAKITDLVDRTVTSDIEVRQEAFFPLLDLPHTLRTTPLSANVLNASGIITTEATVSNGGAFSITLCGLTVGVWEIDIQGFYTANWLGLTTDGLVIRLMAPGAVIFSNLLFLMPTVQPAGIQFSRRLRITLDRGDLTLQSFLAGNGVAQSHQFIASVSCSKLL